MTHQLLLAQLILFLLTAAGVEPVLRPQNGRPFHNLGERSPLWGGDYAIN